MEMHAGGYPIENLEHRQELGALKIADRQYASRAEQSKEAWTDGLWIFVNG